MAHISTGISTPAQIEAAFDILRFSPPADTPPDAMLGHARAFMESYGNADVEAWTRATQAVDVSADGVSARYITAEGGDERRRIIYLHGGGWAAGSANAYRALAAALAKETGCAVLVVDYRLAPEHPYPAGLDDCVAAFAWGADNGPSGPGRADQLFLMGDSAGGNLAAATAMRLAEDDRRGADALVCLSGMLDAVPSGYQAARDEMCNDASVAGAALAYLQGQPLDTHPYISCVAAPRDLLEKLPPTLLQVSGDEYFLDCNRRFAENLSEARVRTILSIWPRLPHVWHQCLDIVPEALGAIREIAGFLATRERSA